MIDDRDGRVKARHCLFIGRSGLLLMGSSGRGPEMERAIAATRSDVLAVRRPRDGKYLIGMTVIMLFNNLSLSSFLKIIKFQK
jgi:hypothetical protein